MVDRWSLTDLESAVHWCRIRAGQNIRCTLAIMAEYAQAPEESEMAVMTQLKAIRKIGTSTAGTSFAVKPSSVGILFDSSEYARNLSVIAREAKARGVPLEIDMEGRPFVEDTLRSVLSLAGEGIPVTLALQVYLDRTPGDLDTCRRSGVTVRLVKGAYLGDSEDFVDIQERFRRNGETLISAGIPFSAATHDPELIDRLKEEVSENRDLIEFSFLKGLADKTKTELASDGWKVGEYVPYGPGGQSYVQRRERYLKILEGLGRAPVP
jgi:proline dehydrogenase